MTDRDRRDEEQFDARLRAAAATLADEALPPGVLEAPELREPRLRTAAPWLAAAAVIIVAVGVGIGLAQIGPPSGTDPSTGPLPPSSAASPSSSVVAEPTSTVAPSSSPAPSVAPLAASLVGGGSACGDGTAGFSFMVPDGWFAERVRESTGCRRLFDAPVDVALVDPEPRIELLVRVESVPSGDIVSSETGVATETPDRFATWHVVNRADEAYEVAVVPLIATLDGAPAYLHIEVPAGDADAVTAARAVVDRLAIREPLTLPAEAVAGAAALYEEPNVDGCLNVELGFATAFPESWWSNTPIGDTPGCVYLAPTSFDIAEDPAQVPDGVAITIQRFSGDYGTTTGDIIGYETLVVDGWPAVRWELGSTEVGAVTATVRNYEVIMSLGEIPEFGPNLVLRVTSTGNEPASDYQLHRAVLDQVVQRIHISPPPAAVVNRAPLPSCGQEIVMRLEDGDRRDAAARECLWSAYEAGDPAEFVSLGVTVEGGRVLDIWRVIGPENVELYVDATHDHGGSLSWELYRCTSITSVRGEADGVLSFGLGACHTPIRLEAPPRP